MPDKRIPTRTVAEGFLAALKARGIDYFFANAGTDFASIVEALSTPGRKERFPEPIAVPHENAAVAMAHGYTMVTGRPQAVMVHVNVGTANAINGLINGLLITQIAVHDFDVKAVERPHRFVTGQRKRTNRLAAFDQPFGQIGAEPACGPGDENSIEHHWYSCAPGINSTI